MSRTSQDDSNDKVRSLLLERGDEGRMPRQTLFFFYGGNLTKLRAAATRAGYRVYPTCGNDGVILETTIAVHKRAFATHAQRMSDWADEFNSNYDGWECQLMNH
jgi:hypothetical protein